MKKLFALGLLVALASAVYALPTVFGTSGGFLVPSTNVQKGVQLSVNSAVDMGSKLPLTQLNWGVLPNLELGAGVFDWGGDLTWGVNVKYALPYEIAKGKLAAAVVYNVETDHSDYTELHAMLIGSWPVFAASTFTAAVDFQGGDINDATAFLFSFVKSFKNGTELGLEYNFNLDSDAIFDEFLEQGGDFGSAYIGFPINEMLSGRVAVTGINNGTDVYAQIGAKF
jgi:hypothetical protein